MSGATHVTVRVPLAIRRKPGRKTVVTPAGDQPTTATTGRADPALLKALARAFRYQCMLDRGQYASISEMAAAERLERGYLGTLLRLTLLTPDIIEAILNGSTSGQPILLRLLQPFPPFWSEQRVIFGHASSSAPGARQ